MEVREIQAKSCLNESKITDYVINPYTGCQHGCAYCYATFIKRFQHIDAEWGKFVFAKVNCPELLEKELLLARPGDIWLSSVTDCYMPLEAKYGLTRKILEVLEKSPRKKDFPVEVLTKSSLVRRDFDLLKAIDAELGMSVNTLDEKTSRVLEPLASSPPERVNTLKEAKEKGLRVYAFISPVMPGITNLEELFRELSFCDYCYIELLNTKKYILDRLMPVFEANFPDKVPLLRGYIADPGTFYRQVQVEARALEKKHGLKIKEISLH
ncbi:MAG: radical SAM protein [Candidatus Aenigmarchaeota archaeon]|nr:radical SAM protein [Candidatus Aenigmarchaeota archaeon]